MVSFSDDEYLFGDWVLAITAKTLKLGATDAETQILDADIIFNPFFVKHQSWSFAIAGDLLNPGYFDDIQSVTTHEIGHILDYCIQVCITRPCGLKCLRAPMHEALSRMINHGQVISIRSQAIISVGSQAILLMAMARLLLSR